MYEVNRFFIRSFIDKISKRESLYDRKKKENKKQFALAKERIKNLFDHLPSDLSDGKSKENKKQLALATYYYSNEAKAAW
ncbi:MAG: hypothetical protein KJ666_09875 [Bacteroidetes bacterium]|nr:hypothetical protein [Bacteroidota bacterium]MBU2585961.1 hypothetical protein [Bacteroidota bacterium]